MARVCKRKQEMEWEMEGSNQAVIDMIHFFGDFFSGREAGGVMCNVA